MKFQKLLCATLISLSPVTSWGLSTRVLVVPVGLALEAGEVKYDLEQRMNLDKSAGSYHRGQWGISYGAARLGRLKAEVGLDWQEPGARTTAAALSAHGRLVFNELREEGWSIGVGLDQLGFHPGDNDLNLGHLVFQNILGNDWEMAFGGYSGNSRFLGSDDKGMFLGAWRLIQSGHGRIGLEWVSGSSELGLFCPGIKVEIRDGVMGQLAYAYANNREAHRDWLLMRISILF